MNFKLPLPVIKILQEINKKGFEGYIVGGAVRDIIMGKKTYDWDFTTNATPEQILEIFPDGFYDNIFGTVGLAVRDLANRYDFTDMDLEEIDPKLPFEITTFRSEKGYSDSRHPDSVEWGKTLEEDLQRRDFTVNAMAFKHVETQDLASLLIDPFDGQTDIKNKIIRAVGDPNLRFSEDALRMIRALRFAAELGFIIEPKTLTAITNNWQLLYKISIERIRDEFIKIIKSPFPADGVRLLATTNLLEVIIPELLETHGVEQSGHHTKDVWGHSLDALKDCPSPDPIVRLATLLHDIGKAKAYRKKDGKITFYGHEVVSTKITKQIAERLKLPTKDKEKLLTLVRNHMFTYSPQMTDAAIRRFIKKIGKENINDMIMLRIGDRLGGDAKATSWRLREFQERIGQVLYTPMQVKDLKVNGNDVMKELGIKPGPKVGEVLNKLFEEIMEDSNKNDREYLLAQIKKIS